MCKDGIFDDILYDIIKSISRIYANQKHFYLLFLVLTLIMCFFYFESERNMGCSIYHQEFFRKFWGIQMHNLAGHVYVVD